MSDTEFASVAPANLETDYLVIGAGAMGMAFADEIFSAKPQARITLVDRRARPGGHWNDAYPFVALHQPAAFYGLNSAKLGTGGSALASGSEIVAYYHRAMQRMLASGRVHFLSKSECRETDNGRATVVSLLDDQCRTEITVTTCVANAAYMDVQVPATHGPRYEVAEQVNIIPINALPQVREPWQKYVIVGAGKTGMDAILFLLDRGVAAGKIRWIVPNDAWLWDRPSIQPGLATAEFTRMLHALVAHSNVEDIFKALEENGGIHRINRDVVPTKWRCATVDPSEVEALRRVQDVVRLGRVQSITADTIQLDKGSIATGVDCLHIDCTADGLAKRPVRPIFAEGQITLQSLVMCQQVLSAAVIGRLAVSGKRNDELNRLFQVVPHPEWQEDLPGVLLASFQNLLNMNRHFPLWMRRSRLNLMHHDSLWDYVAGALEVKRMLPQARAAVQAQHAAMKS